MKAFAKIKISFFVLLTLGMVLTAQLSLAIRKGPTSDINQGKKHLRILMVTWSGYGDIESKFIEALRDRGYSVAIQTIEGLQDRGRLIKRLRELGPTLQEQFDYVYSFGTTASLMVRRIYRGAVPHIYLAVSYPNESGLLKHVAEAKIEMAGLSTSVDPKQLFSLIPIAPHRQKFALFYNPRELNSVTTRDKFKSYCETARPDCQFVDVRITPQRNNLQGVLNNLQNRQYDWVILPDDSFIGINYEKFLPLLHLLNIKVAGLLPMFDDAGAEASVYVDYGSAAKQIVELVDRRERGEAFHTMGIMRPINFITNQRYFGK